MTNSEKLRNMPIDDLLKSIQEQAEKFDVCIMTLLPGGRLLCPWHNDCDKCLQEWLNAVKRYPDDIEHRDLVDEDGAELPTQRG